MSFTIEDLVQNRLHETPISYKKPTHDNQLFFRDFFKLEHNTPIIIHGDKLVGTDPDHEEREKVQFIKVCQDNYGFGSNTWGIHFRRASGIEQKVDLYFLGATKNGNEWLTNIWVTKNEDEERTSYDRWLENYVKK